MTRLLHTADTHLGYRQYHRPERRTDFRDAFEQVVDDAVGADVDAVVHAGDLYHDRRPDLRALQATLAALRRLDDAGIPFLAVVGNHESTRHGQWLDLFERLGLAERLGREPRAVGDVALYGLDHVPPSRRDELDYDFAPHDAAHAALVAHGLFEPFAHADWDTEAVLDAASVGFDAVLLGDNHEPGTEHVDGTPVTYAGSTERTSATERAARGYNLVSFGGRSDGDDAGVRIRRRSLDTRPFVFVSVDLAAGEGVERARERVREHDVTDAVVVVEVDGDEASEPVPPARVEAAALDDGALVARVSDRRDANETDEPDAVRFADPDAAVRERVAELDLSAAARDVDQLVRAGDVADSNLKSAAARRAAALVDDEPDAAESAPDGRDAGASDREGAGADASERAPTGAEGDGAGATDRQATLDAGDGT